MKENKTKPDIRFKGFTDDWEQRKFLELYEKNTERNNKLIGYDRTISIATMSYKDEGNGASDSSLKTYKVLRPGDLAFEGHTNKEFRYGRFVANDIGIGIMSPRFSTLRPIKKMPIDFWKYYIHYEPIMRKVLVNSTKAGTMMNELVVDDFMKQAVFVPSISEQQHLGQYFSQLDNFITLHQRECNQLKELKKTMLKKMFPRDGSNIPEVRFAGFTDVWEQRKFGTLLEETRNKTTVENEDILLSCAIDGMYLNSELFSHFRGSSNIGYIKVKKNDLILSAQNLHLGNCNVNLRFEHGIISPAYKVYELVDCYPLFMQAWVKKDDTKDFFLKASTEGASLCRKNIVWEELYKQMLPIPKLDEQIKIGQYFSQLDNLITLHQRELEILKNLKKTCLKRMFI